MQGNATSAALPRKLAIKTQGMQKIDIQTPHAVQAAAKKGRPAMLGLVAGTLNNGGNLHLIQACLAVMEDKNLLTEPRN